MSIANTEHSENLAVDTNIAIISGVLDDAPRIMHTKTMIEPYRLILQY